MSKAPRHLCQPRYREKFYSALLMPLVLLSIVFAIAKVTTGDAAREKAVKAFLVVTFLLYPTVSQTVFQGIACTQLDSDEYWLTADLSTPCSGGTSPMLKECMLASLLVPIGLPIALFAWMHMHVQQLAIVGSKASRQFSFFVKGYENKFYYWECIEMLRKVVIQIPNQYYGSRCAF